MNRSQINHLKITMNIKPNERVAYAEDETGFTIIKIKKEERFRGYRIIFDGKFYYLLVNDTLLSKNKDKNELIPDGVAKVI